MFEHALVELALGLGLALQTAQLNGLFHDAAVIGVHRADHVAGGRKLPGKRPLARAQLVEDRAVFLHDQLARLLHRAPGVHHHRCGFVIGQKRFLLGLQQLGIARLELDHRLGALFGRQLDGLDLAAGDLLLELVGLHLRGDRLPLQVHQLLVGGIERDLDWEELALGHHQLVFPTIGGDGALGGLNPRRKLLDPRRQPDLRALDIGALLAAGQAQILPHQRVDRARRHLDALRGIADVDDKALARALDREPVDKVAPRDLEQALLLHILGEHRGGGIAVAVIADPEHALDPAQKRRGRGRLRLAEPELAHRCRRHLARAEHAQLAVHGKRVRQQQPGGDLAVAIRRLADPRVDQDRAVGGVGRAGVGHHDQRKDDRREHPRHEHRPVPPEPHQQIAQRVSDIDGRKQLITVRPVRHLVRFTVHIHSARPDAVKITHPKVAKPEAALRKKSRVSPVPQPF